MRAKPQRITSDPASIPPWVKHQKIGRINPPKPETIAILPGRSQPKTVVRPSADGVTPEPRRSSPANRPKEAPNCPAVSLFQASQPSRITINASSRPSLAIHPSPCQAGPSSELTNQRTGGTPCPSQFQAAIPNAAP